MTRKALSRSSVDTPIPPLCWMSTTSTMLGSSFERYHSKHRISLGDGTALEKYEDFVIFFKKFFVKAPIHHGDYPNVRRFFHPAIVMGTEEEDVVLLQAEELPVFICNRDSPGLWHLLAERQAHPLPDVLLRKVPLHELGGRGGDSLGRPHPTVLVAVLTVWGREEIGFEFLVVDQFGSIQPGTTQLEAVSKGRA